MSEKYIAVDGNRIGSVLERLLIEGDCGKISKFSSSLSELINRLANALQETGCLVIMSAGDNILIRTSDKDKALGIIFKYITSIDKITFAVGIGTFPVEAYLALKLAKAKGHEYVDFADIIKS